MRDTSKPKAENHRSRLERIATSKNLLWIGVASLLSGVILGVRYAGGAPVVQSDQNYFLYMVNGAERFLAWAGPSFFKELGFAFIIAYIVARMIEQKSSRARLMIEEEAAQRQDVIIDSYLDQVSRGIFRALYRRNFDDKFAETVEEVLSRAFYVRNYELSVTLDKFTDSTNSHFQVLVTFRAHYFAENISNEAQVFPFQMMIERLSSSTRRHPIKLIKIGAEEYSSDEELESLDNKIANDKNFRRYGCSSKVESGKKCEVIVQAEMKKAYFDEMTWRVFWPSDSFRINVTNNVPSLSVNGIAITSSDGIKDEPELESTSGNAYVLRVDTPLLPGNGGQIWWTKDITPDSSTGVDRDS